VSERRQAIDPAVLAAFSEAEKKTVSRKNGAVKKRKVNVNLPCALVDTIKRESTALTGHGRRGFSDLVAVLLAYGWEAYRAGDLKIELRPATVETKIVAAKK